MSDINSFKAKIQEGYQFSGESIVIGAAMFNHEVVEGLQVKLPLKTLNRHGLIAGATGTGKTKTLQCLAEQLSKCGVPSLLMDIKGDLSGIAIAGESNSKILDRTQKIGIDFKPEGNTVELLSLSQEKGARLRATVTEFGPVLFSKILDLNDTQSGVVAIVFKYSDDNNLPLLDLEDFKKILQYMTNEGKDEAEQSYGLISSATSGSILRKIIELEQQGAAQFFGERSFEVNDLLRKDDCGNGVISILRVTDIQDKPKLFSTFMLQMLAELYATLPEAGDLDKPKLALFIDEAHLVFNEASSALMDQIEAIIKLIRSKGVGIFFITQNPADIPDSVLGQLGLKIQHASRAFTAKDRKAIKLAAENYPETTFYTTEDLITEMGIGESIITVLSERGTPTPLVHTLMRPPQSRMDILTGSEIEDIVSQSELVTKYNKVINRESAAEILAEKIKDATDSQHQDEIKEQKRKAVEVSPKKEKSFLEQVFTNSTTRSVANTVTRELTRGLLGVLGIGGRRKGGLF